MSSSARPLIFVDLDDTLFQTLRKSPDGGQGLAVAALGRDGGPGSVFTPKQAALVQWLASGADLVAITGRARAAFDRVRLCFSAAIIAHGALILDAAGQEDAAWSRHLAPRIAAGQPALEEARAALEKLTGDKGMAVEVMTEGERRLYPVARAAEADQALLEQLAAETRPPEGWTEVMTDRVLAWIPPWLGKAPALDWFLATHVPDHDRRPILGFGDHPSDLPFLQRCDWLAFPRRSILARRLAP